MSTAKTKIKELRQYRHGDVFLQEVPALPSDTQPVKSAVLAEGTATGHSHRLAGNFTLSRGTDGLYVKVGPKGATLNHEEHATIHLPKGSFLTRIQVEDSVEGEVAVMD